MATRRSWGSIRKLGSGRYQVRYTASDGSSRLAPRTFETKAEADAWLSDRRFKVDHPEVRLPEPTPTLGAFADGWLASRTLRPRTRALYAGLLAGHILPALGDVALAAITPATVRAWHANLTTGPTRRAHAYALLRTILETAVDDELIKSNPCRVRGAGVTRRARRIRPATLPELERVVAAMPDRLALTVLLGSWCGLRLGEVLALRRSDVDLGAGVLRVRRSVGRVTGAGMVVGEPKTDAGSRDVAIPPHLIPMVADHLRTHAARGPGGLLFPSPAGGHLSDVSLYRWYHPARAAAGRPDLRFHDLRHTGAVLAAATGATLAELMARLGHSTPQAAMRYQHAAADRDQVIAAALSDLAAGARVVPLLGRRAT